MFEKGYVSLSNERAGIFMGNKEKLNIFNRSLARQISKINETLRSFTFDKNNHH